MNREPFLKTLGRNALLAAVLGLVFFAAFPRSDGALWDYFDVFSVALCFTLVGHYIEVLLLMLPGIETGGGKLVRLAGGAVVLRDRALAVASVPARSWGFARVDLGRSVLGCTGNVVALGAADSGQAQLLWFPVCKPLGTRKVARRQMNSGFRVASRTRQRCHSWHSSLVATVRLASWNYSST